MIFTKEYFEGEERDGFYISPLRKRHWAATLEVLEKLDKICKKYKIRYYISFGTLIGAVRHKGFIPWDDDLDIVMKRPDFERFLQVAQKEMVMYEKWNQSDKSGKLLIHHSRFAKRDFYLQAIVANSSSITFDPEYLKRNHGCPFAVAVDIFPLDYFPELGVGGEADTVIELCRIMGEMLYSDIWNEQGYIDDVEWFDKINQIGSMFGFSFKNEPSLRSRVAEQLDRVYTIYKEKESKYLIEAFLYAHSSKENPNRKCLKEWYDEVVYLPFEGMMVPAPKEYDKILTAFYGDYMKPVNYGGHGDKEMKVLLDKLNYKGDDVEAKIEALLKDYV